MSAVKKYLEGIRVLEEWFYDEGEVVSNDLAQKRANICLKCPMNQSENPLAELAAKAIKRKMEEKLCRNLHVDGIESLKTCSACSCWTPIKIWFPVQQILPKQKERQNFHKDCWILSES